MSEIIDELTMLETWLGQEQISALMAMAKQPQGVSFAPGELNRIANLHTVLLAVRSELAARQPREGWSNPAAA
jgi:hypothetical protein